MDDQGSFFAEPQRHGEVVSRRVEVAHARNTDPETSHEAARSVEPKLRESQEVVLSLMRSIGPATDDRIYAEAKARGVKISTSGCRTRRSELVTMEFARFTGMYDRLESGRRARIWEAT